MNGVAFSSVILCPLDSPHDSPFPFLFNLIVWSNNNILYYSLIIRYCTYHFTIFLHIVVSYGSKHRIHDAHVRMKQHALMITHPHSDLRLLHNSDSHSRSALLWHRCINQVCPYQNIVVLSYPNSTSYNNEGNNVHSRYELDSFATVTLTLLSSCSKLHWID